MPAPVYFYYRLTDVMQNNKRMTLSIDYGQIYGDPTNTNYCPPLEKGYVANLRYLISFRKKQEICLKFGSRAIPTFLQSRCPPFHTHL